MKNRTDNIYADEQAKVGDFVFDKRVADVFDDMIRRSVPGYEAIINMIGTLTGEYAQKGSRCYDLGCSLGASSLAMARYAGGRDIKIVAVDNSKEMIQKCRENIWQAGVASQVDLVCEDIENVSVDNASIIVLNFTLQFIHPDKRLLLLRKMGNGLRPGGILILSDKIAFSDPQEQKRQEAFHRSFKKLNGYSDLEISQKRTALENVLIPDTIEAHQKRLAEAGFKESRVWFRCFNFASLIAFK